MAKENYRNRKKYIQINTVIHTVLILTCMVSLLSFAQEETAKKSAATIIEQALDDMGIEATKAKFFLLKAQKDAYSFVEDEFLTLSNRLLQADRYKEAASILEMAAELFPQSINLHRLLATSYYKDGYTERSFASIKKMRSIRDGAMLGDFITKNEGKLASTTEEVIERHIEASGGEAAWNTVKTMVMELSTHSTSGESITLVRMYKRPHLFRQGVKGSNRFSTTDGERVWNVRDNEWQEIQSKIKPYIPVASMDNWLIDYAAKGISYALIGLEFLNDSPVYHLRRTFRDGRTQELYFSALSNLLTEIRSDYIEPWPFMMSYFSLWNYREVEGIKIPFVTIRNVGPLGPPHGAVIEDVKINIPLDDDLFLPPKYKNQ